MLETCPKARRKIFWWEKLDEDQSLDYLTISDSKQRTTFLMDKKREVQL